MIGALLTHSASLTPTMRQVLKDCLMDEQPHTQTAQRRIHDTHRAPSTAMRGNECVGRRANPFHMVADCQRDAVVHRFGRLPVIRNHRLPWPCPCIGWEDCYRAIYRFALRRRDHSEIESAATAATAMNYIRSFGTRISRGCGFHPVLGSVFVRVRAWHIEWERCDTWL